MLGGRPALERVFAGPGASELLWEVATRCDCINERTKEPTWGCPDCAGLGTTYTGAVAVRGLFRGQSRWVMPMMMGEHGLGEAELTTAAFDLTTGGVDYPACKPAYTDHRVRDRFTVVRALGDIEQGRVFYPAAQPVPFLFGSEHLAWRVQLQGADQATRILRQP